MSASVFCGCPSSDVTYLWAGNRWTCLAVLIDLFARKRTGWALSSSPDSEFTCKALWMACESRGRPNGVRFHSAQGCHDTSLTFRQPLWRYRIAKAGYPTQQEARRDLVDDLIGYYSQTRPHQYNGG